MSDTSDNLLKDYVLPNGFTFFATTAGYRGTWACDKDPVTAARKAAKRNGPYPHFVSVWYAPYETTEVTDGGGLSWMPETANTIVPIGFFKLTSSTMKKSTDEALTHEAFMDHWQKVFKNSYQHWLEVDSKKAS